MSVTTEIRHPLVRLRDYQREAGRAIVASAGARDGRSFSVQIARQGGKNELSAQIEILLLTMFGARGDIIKCAPTFEPQLRISRLRLLSSVLRAGLRGLVRVEPNAVRFGEARILFLSAERGASVVGHTAGLLLEVDEAQDVDPEKFDRDFRPMASSTNATTVYYGTPWDEGSLLERAKQAHLDAERRDGVRRHFEYDWTRVAACNPAYGRYVEGERERLGETHPLFLTQYCLQLIAGGGRLLSASQRAQLAGGHERRSQPDAGDVYVAGLDVAGGDEGAPSPARDATALTIGRLVQPPSDALVREPRVEVVEHIAWTGEPHETLLPRLVDLLRDTWRVARVAIDATGIGETAARLIAQALGEQRVEAVKFSAQRKSELGFDLLAAINGGRLKMYRSDGSPESHEFWSQADRAKAAYRANQTMNFFVDPSEGHDDYVISLALVVAAARDIRPRIARARPARMRPAQRRSVVGPIR